MFDLIGKYSNLLVSGSYGISKSISIMLYSILSNHINLYRYQASKPSMPAIVQK